MSRASALYRLYLGLAALGIVATGLALVAALRSVSFTIPAADALLAACKDFVLPNPGLASVAALGLGSLAFAVVALGVRSVVRQRRASRRFLAALTSLAPQRLADVDVVVFGSEQVSAFCAGLLRPRVFISSRAVADLDADELAAVVAHEAHHARVRDPLRIFLARALGDSLFFLPVLRRLGEGYASLAELAADAAAIRGSRGDTRPLASALLAFSGPADRAVVGIAPERVDQMLGERHVWRLPAALLLWAGIAVIGLAAVAQRAADASSMAPLNMPLVIAQMCMVAMTMVPLMAGGVLLLRGRRQTSFR